jgi:hypothetical protein
MVTYSASIQYTDISKVEALIQILFDGSDVNNPTRAQVNVWIDEVSKEIDHKALGYYGVVGELTDANGTPYVYLNRQPIICITGLGIAVNLAEQDEATDYEYRLEGPGANTHFNILRKAFGNKTLGYTLYFYDDVPEAGTSRIFASYAYGWNMDWIILSEYATAKVAVRVIEYLSARPENVVLVQQGGYKTLMDNLNLRITQIEAMFPQRNVKFT